MYSWTDPAGIHSFKVNGKAKIKKHLQENLPGLDVVYHTGPAGNQSPRYYVSGQTFAEADRLGCKL